MTDTALPSDSAAPLGNYDGNVTDPRHSSQTEISDRRSDDLDLDAPAMTKREAVCRALVLIECIYLDAQSDTCQRMNAANKSEAVSLLETVLGIKS